MILVKGTRVVFDLERGGSKVAPARHGLMHDPAGRQWPQRSALVGPYEKTRQPVEDAKARHYFGRSYQAHVMRVSLPPRALSSGWESLGEVDRIWYTRPGTKYPGPFQHGFNKGWWPLVFGKKRVLLYRGHGFYRLEFPDGATLDDRGFVRP